MRVEDVISPRKKWWQSISAFKNVQELEETVVWSFKNFNLEPAALQAAA